LRRKYQENTAWHREGKVVEGPTGSLSHSHRCNNTLPCLSLSVNETDYVVWEEKERVIKH